MSGLTWPHISDRLWKEETELERQVIRAAPTRDRKKLIKLLSLNICIAAANIITFSPALIGLTLFGGGALETALGSTFIFLSGAGLIYGNYKLLTEPEKSIPTNKVMTVEDYIEELNAHRGLRAFQETVDLLLDQIDRLQKKNKIIRDILLQIFSASEISYKKFDAVIAEVEKIFFITLTRITWGIDLIQAVYLSHELF